MRDFIKTESVHLKFPEELFLCNTSGQLFLNLLQIVIVPAPPACLTCIWENGGGE